MIVDDRAAYVIRELNRHGHQAYLVGGCVRDFLLGGEPKDWDITTSATPGDVISCFAEKAAVIETGIRHGTVSVLIKGLLTEVTTFRKDGVYADNRHPSGVTFVHDLKDDLARRDFTINALAYDLNTGIVDYSDGKSDLENHRIRAVGDPDQRLNEDALRILRALRFSSVLAFGIERSLAGSIHRNRTLLLNISSERISAELSKMIVGDNILNILLDYPDVLSVFIPEIKPSIGFEQKNPYHIHDVWTHTAHCVALAAPALTVRLAMLFHDLGKPETFTPDDDGVGHFYGHNKVSEEIASRRLRELRFGNETIDTVAKLIRWHDVQIPPNRLVRWLNKLGENLLRGLLAVKRADALAQNELFGQEKIIEIEKLESDLDLIIENNSCCKLTDLMITGDDILGLGVEQGPEIGKILNALLDKVMDGELENERTALLSDIQSQRILL